MLLLTTREREGEIDGKGEMGKGVKFLVVRKRGIQTPRGETDL